jgi:hypothetical protein
MAVPRDEQLVRNTSLIHTPLLLAFNTVARKPRAYWPWGMEILVDTEFISLPVFKYGLSNVLSRV